eukprot:m51a1_g12639 hypothetical protein (103) ;mRNA; f:3154-3601
MSQMAARLGNLARAERLTVFATSSYDDAAEQSTRAQRVRDLVMAAHRSLVHLRKIHEGSLFLNVVIFDPSDFASNASIKKRRAHAPPPETHAPRLRGGSHWG